ncbi:hypothetical protein BU23DRAFT_628727, partial [Bimuria novae-zelandiae CBS 107.79]
ENEGKFGELFSKLLLISDLYFSLHNRPWFRRGWIIQEVAMTKELEVICGDFCMHGDSLFVAMEFLTLLHGRMLSKSPFTYDRVISICVLRRGGFSNWKPSLLQLLLRHRSSCSTDPRDKVFELLGLAADNSYDMGLLKPDYTLDEATIYRRSAIAMLKAEKSLRVLSVPHQDRASTNLKLLSWVPNWIFESTAFSLKDSTHTQHSEHTRRASGESTAQILISKNERMLGLEVFFVDQISQSACVMDLKAIYIGSSRKGLLGRLFREVDDSVNRLFVWEAFAKPSSKSIYKPTNETMFHAFWKTMVTGRVSDDASREEFVQWYKLYLPLSGLRRFLGPRIISRIVDDGNEGLS